MVQTNLLLLIIKLVAGGIAAFFAIMLWSRTRDAAWACLVAGVVALYAGIVYDMLVQLGVVVDNKFIVAGIPVAAIVFAVLPSCFFTVAFILMIRRN
ncbi:MAG: hypothetical protein J6I73_07825 [Treponema sp.]|nr:hypothetical protein [Treponema sp.]